MAACTALAHRLEDHPTTWPYGRFSISWKNFDGDLEPSTLGYGEATNGCYSVVAGQWHGDESGIATAWIPSSDRDEIRGADAADKAVTAAWNARIAEGNGLEPFSASDAIDVGFDPVEKAAYLWARDTDGVLVGRAQRANFQDAVSATLCRKLTAEYNRNKTWKYVRWSVAVYQGNNRIPELIGSGECAH